MKAFKGTINDFWLNTHGSRIPVNSTNWFHRETRERKLVTMLKIANIIDKGVSVSVYLAAFIHTLFVITLKVIRALCKAEYFD